MRLRNNKGYYEEFVWVDIEVRYDDEMMMKSAFFIVAASQSAAYVATSLQVQYGNGNGNDWGRKHCTVAV